ncbi:MAG: hypothetical protein MNSN_02670 [Minisyncoccus archaeiphilus]|jgi:hypothetical protein|uniref:hypothetical protein n=1 Tax=Minisyncoccus archaeiphilus TaxID=3238481 RepID=UPI0009CBAF2D|nr:MAG: hypothetical protein BWY21_00457 [Parcubacteria group bacterium ADurb.Bin216]GMX59269.1 MAG: hypothetical protein MNSN_02670 [Candidatus Parcubacteria bacterium]
MDDILMDSEEYYEEDYFPDSNNWEEEVVLEDWVIDFAIHAEREACFEVDPKSELFLFYMLTNYRMHVHLNSNKMPVYIR